MVGKGRRVSQVRAGEDGRYGGAGRPPRDALQTHNSRPLFRFHVAFSELVPHIVLRPPLPASRRSASGCAATMILIDVRTPVRPSVASRNSYSKELESGRSFL